ncbi:hypothetical protein I4F81_006339 [Pyropia yezoensis]|uniref:Uncharacterized protein n=1 Tax=Pyropia yezoensis TaxID=2788 RepID=A0ACC3C0Z1_PYRYE|nr:hypothetical protein I4F81_006339 [Neopyropia yezoensis]
MIEGHAPVGPDRKLPPAAQTVPCHPLLQFGTLNALVATLRLLPPNWHVTIVVLQPSDHVLNDRPLPQMQGSLCTTCTIRLPLKALVREPLLLRRVTKSTLKPHVVQSGTGRPMMFSDPQVPVFLLARLERGALLSPLASVHNQRDKRDSRYRRRLLVLCRHAACLKQPVDGSLHRGHRHANGNVPIRARVVVDDCPPKIFWVSSIVDIKRGRGVMCINSIVVCVVPAVEGTLHSRK